MDIETRIKELLDEEELIKNVRITREAFEKMNLYAKFVSQIASTDIECGGVLLNYRNKYDDIARDVYLMKDQEVTAYEGRLKIGESYGIAKAENKKVCGIWHSHGTLGTSHSEWDDSQLRVLYASNRENKIQVGKRKYSAQTNYEDGILNIKAGDKLIRIKTEKELEIESEQLIEKKFVSSIVINIESYLSDAKELGDEGYYAECMIEGKKRGVTKKLKKLGIELVDENNGIVKDYESLIKECGEVVYGGEYLKDHPNYQNVLTKYANLETKVEEKKEPKEKRKNLCKKNKKRYSKIKEAAITTGVYGCIGLLLISIVALKGIEKASLYQIRKTRPDVVYMIEKGKSFSEISKVYFAKNDR